MIAPFWYQSRENAAAPLHWIFLGGLLARDCRKDPDGAWWSRYRFLWFIPLPRTRVDPVP